MSKKVILTAKNYDSTKSCFTYSFPFPQDFTNYEVCLSQFNMFNAWPNISSAIGNNKVIIQYPSADGSTYTSITGTIPDGFYDTTSFNLYLQSLMYENNLYFKSVTGTVTYYLSLDLLSTEYKNSVTLYKMSGVTIQSGTVYNTNRDIYLNISFNSNLGELFGFSSNVIYGPTTYSATSTTTKKITKSNLTPQINPFNSIIILCDLVNQLGFANPSDFLFSCGLNVSYGSMIEPKKIENIYMRCREEIVKSVTLTIVDNNFNKLSILDNNTMLILTFRPKEPKNNQIKK